VTVDWRCPDCGGVEMIEVVGQRAWPEMVAHYQQLAQARHSLRVCMYTLALKAAA
jgi:hypothetical protein